LRVLIIDDHPLFRQGMTALLRGFDPGIECQEVGDVPKALELALNTTPFDLVLLDLGLPGLGGLDGLAEVKRAFDSAAVVIVSAQESPILVRDAISAGAAGYVPKSTDPGVTLQALRLVISNGTYLPPIALSGLIGSGPRKDCRTDGKERPTGPVMSPRQLEILKLLLQGHSNKVIARKLNLAEGTVKAHLWAVYQVLGVASRGQAMFRAHELGLFDMDCSTSR
jgi:DNA-binding NarL/FixJ family response regulator